MRPLIRSSISILLLTIVGLFASCTDDLETGSAPVILDPSDGTVTPYVGCPDHEYREESIDDACCGCHFFSLLDCDAECGTADPPPPPPPPTCEGDTCQPPTGGYLEHGPTYYRIGGGAEPRDGEYEYAKGESGENGKLLKSGGPSNKGVSFFSTEEDAKAARDRIGSKAKIHKVSFYNETDLVFIGKQPPANHFHLAPNREMTLAEFKAALKKVRMTKVEQ